MFSFQRQFKAKQGDLSTFQIGTCYLSFLAFCAFNSCRSNCAHKELLSLLQRKIFLYRTCFELMIFSMSDVPIFVAAPTDDVAIPAISNGAASPAVVKVKMPPAMVRLPPTTEALVPTDFVMRHLKRNQTYF